MPYHRGSRSSSSESAVLHHNVSTVALNEQIKHQPQEGPFAFFTNFLATVGSPTRLKGEKYSVASNLQLH